MREDQDVAERLQKRKDAAAAERKRLLRNQFAGLALQACIEQHRAANVSAEAAFKYADAMMIEEAKGSGKAEVPIDLTVLAAEILRISIGAGVNDYECGIEEGLNKAAAFVLNWKGR